MSEPAEVTMTPPRPTVSLIIPAYNEEASISECLLAAITQTEPIDEILVVDNRSTDRTAEAVRAVQTRFPTAPIRLIAQNERQGLVPTRNAGFAAARSDILGRIDADCLLERDWAEQVRTAFVADPGVDAVTGPVNYYDMPLRSLGLWADHRIRRMVWRISGEHAFLFGSNMALRVDAWRTIAETSCPDAADEMHEDIDLAVHLRQAGRRIAYVPTMVTGMSARRLEDSPRDYGYYVTRFERTYARHGIRSIGARTPMLVFLAIYPPLKLMRLVRGRVAERAPVSVAAVTMD